MRRQQLLTEPGPEFEIAKKAKWRVQHLRDGVECEYIRHQGGHDLVRRPICEELACLKGESGIVICDDADWINHPERDRNLDCIPMRIDQVAARIRY